MEWLYDDAFYYLITAKHFSEQHISSFDGVTRTSGYHPLWMWLCAFIYGLRGRLDLTYVRLCMGLALTISGATLLFALLSAYRHRRAGLLWALGLAACSYSALNNGCSVMEWPLVIFCWYLLHRLLIPRDDCRSARPGKELVQPVAYIACFTTGFAGSLSRTDFGLIPACYLAAALLLALKHRTQASAFRALAALCGAAFGILVVFVYDRQMTGSWMQGSAQAKRLAASVSVPFNPVPAVWQFLRVLFFLPAMDLSADRKAMLLRGSLALLLPVFGLLAFGAIAARKRLAAAIKASWPVHPAEQFALVAAILGVTGYVFLYAFNTQATYGWYSASVTGFIILLAARGLRTLRPTTAAAIVLPLMLANIIAAESFGGNARAQWQEVVGGKAMHHDHPTAVMGGGDVGKPSFYNGGTILNIDGLMNNEVLPYIANGNIHCYILRRRIEFLSNLGTVTAPIVDAERLRLRKPPLPWTRYFTNAKAIPEDQPSPVVRPYLQTNFEAIQASGECPND
jgi:hypothetical protein